MVAGTGAEPAGVGHPPGAGAICVVGGVVDVVLKADVVEGAEEGADEELGAGDPVGGTVV